jgi:hypothetical protein
MGLSVAGGAPPVCSVCTDYGELYGASIAVQPDPPCTGDTISFAVSGVMDSGGWQRVDCVDILVFPGMPSYTWELTLPPLYPPPLPPLSGSGATASAEAKVPGTYSCEFTAKVARECSPPDRTISKSVVTPGISSVEWSTYPGNTPLNVCPKNGGQRIFPDKVSAADGAAAERPKADLVARISPVVQGCQVHFKVFDVDDPFDQLRACPCPPENPNCGCIADVSLIDTTPTSGPDNRGAAGGLSPPSALADANGEVRVTFTVSMQPGDNFRAGASVVESRLNATTQTQADVNAPPQYVKFTDMLTLWRKLHIEFDTMLPEPTTVSGREPDRQEVSVVDVTVNATTSTLHLANPLSGHNPHQFEGGTVDLTSSGGLPLTVWDHANATVDVTRVLTPPEMPYVKGRSGHIKDDDPTSGLLPKFYTISPFIRNAYEDAYIEIEDLDATWNPNHDVPFDLYLTEFEMGTGWGWNDAQDRASSSGYWTSFVLAAYQAYGSLLEGSILDNDPDPLQNNATFPNGPYWTGEGYEETLQTGWTIDSGDWESVLFRATIVDFPHWAHFEDQVLAHEIGHSGGNTGTEAQHHAEGCLMRKDIIETDDHFCGMTLKRFREAVKW